MANIQDTDLMIVNRESQTYKVTGAELKDKLIPPIVFSPAITGDNIEGDLLTASAEVITGGKDPIEYAFQWRRNNTSITEETGKYYTLVLADVGTTISCDVTVAEPDGYGAVTQTAVYDKVPEVKAEIFKPTIIAPPDGAGVGGGVTYTPKTSAIKVDGVDTITELVADGSPYMGGTVDIGDWWDAVSLTSPDNMFDGNLDSYWNIQFTKWAEQPFYIFPTPLGSDGDKISLYVKLDDGCSMGIYTVGTDGELDAYFSITGPADGWYRVGGETISKPIGKFQITNTTSDANGEVSHIFGIGAIKIQYGSTGEKYLLSANPPRTEATLTLTNSNTYNADTDEDMNQPISETFTAGQTVTGVKAGSPTAAGTLVADAVNNTMTVTVDESPEFKSTTVSLYNWTNVAFGNDRFVTCSNQGGMYSFDGITWSAKVMAASHNWSSVIYGENKFVAVSVDGSAGASVSRIQYSDPTASTWTLATGPAFMTSTTFTSVTYGNGKFVAVGSSGGVYIAHSSDGTVWENAAPIQNGMWQAVTYGELSNGTKRFVAISSNTTPRTMFSDNGGESWLPGSGTAASQAWKSIAYGNGKYVAVGPSGVTTYSTDGQNWTAGTIPGSSGWNSVTYGNGYFIAVTDGGPKRVAISKDGEKWELTESSDQSGWRAVAAGDDLIVAVAESGNNRVMYSPVFGDPFVDGMEVIKDTEVTKYGPGADVLEFVGSEPTSDPVDAITTWGDATWEVSTDNGFTSPMVGTKVITPGSNQTLAPSERGTIVLDYEIDYYARLSYNATDPSLPNVTSSAVHFRTAPEVLTVDDLFSVDLWSGNSATQKITNGVNTTEKALVWVKAISQDMNHNLTDTENGNDSYLSSNTQLGLTTESNPAYPPLASFDIDGYTLGYNTYTNSSGIDYVGYSFKAAPGFFDVVKWTGQDDGTKIPHNLGIRPGCVMVKNLTNVEDWAVFAKIGDAVAPDQYAYYSLVLNDDSKNSQNRANVADSNTLNPQGFNKETLNNEYIAYLFGDVEGMIKCGGYLGASSGDTVVDCGFEPQWVMIKNTEETGGPWIIFDNKRPGLALRANDSGVAWDYTPGPGKTSFKFTSDGFEFNGTPGNVNVNSLNVNYVYIAIAKGGSTAFFDTEAFEAITDNDVIARYGVDPYTTNLEPFGIQRLMNEPTGVTAGYALCEDSDTLCPIQDLSNTVSGLQDEVETAETRATALKQVISRTAIAVAGYYPLYETEEMSDAAGDGTSHSHELNGVTYYMPNGVTIYHGDYTS